MANGGRLERIKKHRRQTKKKNIQNWNNQLFTIYADMHERINTMTTYKAENQAVGHEQNIKMDESDTQC